MSLKPLNDRVLVKRLESEERTASGLYIPDTAKEKPASNQYANPFTHGASLCIELDYCQINSLFFD